MSPGFCSGYVKCWQLFSCVSNKGSKKQEMLRHRLPFTSNRLRRCLSKLTNFLPNKDKKIHQIYGTVCIPTYYGEHLCVLHKSRSLNSVLVKVYRDGKHAGLEKGTCPSSWQLQLYTCILLTLFKLKSVPVRNQVDFPSYCKLWLACQQWFRSDGHRPAGADYCNQWLMEFQDDSDGVLQFVSVTGTDSELAKYFLMENGGDLEGALNMYFANQSIQDGDIVVIDDEEETDQGGGNQERGAGNGGSLINDPDVILLDQDDGSEIQEINKASSPAVAQDSRGSTGDFQIKLICWNIDGLDNQNLRERTTAIISLLKRESPEIIFLQEVIPESLVMIQERLQSDYHIFPGGKMAYFTSMLLKKKDFVLKTVMVEPFPNSAMLRNLTVAKVLCHGLNFRLMTSHLESLANHSEERQRQLKIVFTKMVEVDPDTVSIFGGDTNTRDHEVSAVKSGVDNVKDVWEALGSQKENRYTWDMTQNDNLQMTGRCPRLRFDRLYYYQQNQQLVPIQFDLIGKERLACGRFMSDHWGIRCIFKVKRSANSASSSGT
ncbi:Tyrosyl-DNA phosphodiesterase 2 [Holothuria leucospilota]|uniref:Tyrosyl-DNA phosphodiesterase 2 n=1 Tax=Holothuria leucospilota TaxID=206669 RepID=A0A9Q1BHN1_HOLLE|nr:Tyrosyl-DNA phosphodiesterase 2 [Holothuria leucospilota]